MTMLNLAQVIACTAAEGPGRRFAIWFQGCPLRCPGCCNPEMLPFVGGSQVELTNICHDMKAAKSAHNIEGISLLGGEPFAHADGATKVAAFASSLNLSVMIYSGYTLAELENQTEPAVAELFALTDVLVDGRYEQNQPESRRRWVGSANQQVHFLTSRYSPDDPCWTRSNTLELRLRGNELTVNGFPAPAAVGLWRRMA